MYLNIRTSFILLICLICTSLFGVGSETFQLKTQTKLIPSMPKNQLPTLIDEHALIVVHATQVFDKEMTAKKGIDKVIAKFKALGRPIIYLVSSQDDTGYKNWYTSDRNPTYEIFSEGGEHNLPISYDEVTIVGGFFGSTDTKNGCHTLATKDAIRMHSNHSNRPLKVHMPIEAVYFYNEDSFARECLLEGKPVPFDFEEHVGGHKFATIFFLRNDPECRGDTGNEVDFGHYYFGNLNKNYIHGEPVDRTRYKFTIFLNGRQMESAVGKGPKEVFINLYSKGAYLSQL